MFGLGHIYKLGTRSIQLLPPPLRKKFWQSIAAGLAIAIAEWFSLAAVIPAVLDLIDVDQSFSSRVVHNLIGSLSPLTLVSVVLTIFIGKTFLVLSLSKMQLYNADQTYTEFSERMYRAYFAQDFVAHARERDINAFRKIKLTTFDFSHHVVLGLATLITEAAIFILVTLLLIAVRPAILILLIAIGAPTIILSFLYRRYWVKQIDHSFRELTPQVNSILSQGIESFTEARIYNKQEYFIARFRGISSKTSELLTRLKMLAVVPSRIVEVVGAILFMCVAFFGNARPDSSEMLVMVGLLSIALYKVMPSVIKAANVITQIQSYAYAVDDIEKELSNASVKCVACDPVKFERSIVVSNLAYQYPGSKNRVFEDVNLQIDKGDFVIVKGVSGSGKTTFLHILAGLIRPSSGTIYIDEVELHDPAVSGWQQRLGYVSQAPAIHNDTILNNILFTADTPVDHPKLHRAIDASGFLSVLASLENGLQSQVGEHGMVLSGGQRQRLALARAIYRNPQILLLDEVTNQLDEKNKTIILKKLKALTSEGMTIVLSTHDPIAVKFATKEVRIGHETLAEGSSTE